MIRADKKYIFVLKSCPGAALRSHYHLLSSLAVTVTCTSVVLSAVLFVLIPICSSISPSVSLCRYFFICLLVQCVLLSLILYILGFCVSSVCVLCPNKCVCVCVLTVPAEL